jgi:plastocyanin
MTPSRIVAHTTPVRLLLGAALAAVAVAGCGSSSGSGSSSASETTKAPAAQSTTSSTTPTSSSSTAAAGELALEANPEGQLKYSTTSLSANAGKVTIDFKNSSMVGHNVTLEDSSGKTLGATETFSGGARKLSLTLKAGVYKFFCSVPGHRMAGMEGTLTVH